jgi:hypothetical protein
MSFRNPFTALAFMAICTGGIFVVVGDVPGASAATRPSSALLLTTCQTVTVGGHTYIVEERSTTCSVADKGVASVAGKRLKAHSLAVPVSGGPSGFSCRAQTKLAGVNIPGIAANVQTSGNCTKGVGGIGFGTYFNWIIKTNY